MKITHDMHTHTTYSHGKNTIAEMVAQARKIGLTAITISDHGRSHPVFGVRKKNFAKMRAEIDALNQKYDDIDIYLSVESNIIGANGDIDIKEEEKKYCDWISAGYHYGYFPASIKDIFVFALPNYAARVLPFLRKAVVEMNTRTYIKMMERYDIKLITHPGDKMPINIEAVAKAAAEHGVILEINPRHNHLNAEEIKIAMKYPVSFAINSDAHSIAALGDMRAAPEVVKAAGIPITRIVNITD
ncbi:MAG: histidinol-phosphatase [Acetobacterium sp. MES1]|uniref:PHP domain-containing protein n=1 Tax=Acetobacterium TaxID=33951 RepID=UPI000B9D49BE|nr:MULTISPECIES: PHP domain-containing protein [Acetobacterium]OXS24841.1 MAG: histidinol-phosphatase [Acetobacterium sp. MES1]VUZ26375.1 putative phosphatase YcdX [Acetobacterium wieringae]